MSFEAIKKLFIIILKVKFIYNISFRKKIFFKVYHVCHDGREGEQGASFLCTNGTIFNQAEFACDWWYNVDCGQATSLYQ